MKENTGALHVQVPVDVGTFLLNEKRVDIARIEMRHRVNLLIIPNRHLETPQHEIIRLRHDQLNQEGPTLASYEMAVKPVEADDDSSTAQAEGKAPRAEAAVKGITPDQPAPIVAPKEPTPPAQEPGLIAKIMSWFSGGKKEEVVESPAKKTEKPVRRERSERGDSRGDRSGRGRRDGKESRERSERPERSERKEGGERKERDNRPNRKERGEKSNDGRRDNRNGESRPTDAVAKPKPAESDVAQKEIPVIITGNLTENSASDTAGEGSRRRGRRGGRGRGERRNEESGTTETTGSEAITTVTSTEAVPVAVPPAPTFIAPEHVVAEPVPKPSPIPQAQPVEEIMAPVPTVAVEAPTATVETVITIEPVTVPVVAPPPPPPPPVDLSANLQQAGLQMVETSSSSPAVPTVTIAPQQLGRKPKLAAIISEEPMQMVETQNK